MKVPNFHQNLSFGQKFEKLCVEYLEDYDEIEHAPDRFFSDWDMKVTHKNGEVFTYEVKTDRMVRKTGNFFIEVQDDGRASGLMATKADYYMLIKPTEDLNTIDIVYQIPTETMREFHKKATNYRMTEYRSYGFLLPEAEVDKLVT